MEQTKPQNQQRSTCGFIRNFWAGGIASSIAITGTYPLRQPCVVFSRGNYGSPSYLESTKHVQGDDGVTLYCTSVVKPIWNIERVLQSQQSRGYVFIEEEWCHGILDGIRRRTRMFGLTSLWWGLNSAVVRNFPHYALNFALNDFYRKLLVDDEEKNAHTWTFFIGSVVSGGTAGATALYLTWWPQPIQNRLFEDSVNQSRSYTGFWDCAKKTLKKEGLTSLHEGIGSALPHFIVHRAIYFGGFDIAKEIFFKDPDNASIIISWMLAQAVSSVGRVVSYPLSTIHTRIALDIARKESTREYKNIFDCANKIMKSEGASGFFKGVLSGHSRAPSGGLVLVLYDELKKLMHCPSA